MLGKQSITGSESNLTAGITLSAENLGKRYNREWIFRNLTRVFTPGNVYAITGPNGSGKSTLLHVLWGQVPQTTGHILYKRAGSAVLPEDIYRHISIAAPYMELIDEFTLAEQINFHFKLKTIRAGCSCDSVLDIFGIKAPQSKYIGNFSSGMKQRLKLGLAFYTAADFIFLDEPGTNLDHQAFEWYQNQLSLLPPHTTIFIASNNPKEYPPDANVVDLLNFKL